MKKNIIALFFILITMSVYSQSTQLDFTMQFQNSNSHEALIYPNPIHNLNFNVKSYSVITDVAVTDMLGKIIISKHLESFANQEITVDLPRCDKGVYFVKITFDDGETIIKKLLYQ